jgi:ABC-type transport system involved in cytochrome c biogenesis ATPase subunit
MDEHRKRGGIVIAATHVRLDLPAAREISLGGAA